MKIKVRENWVDKSPRAIPEFILLLLFGFMYYGVTLENSWLKLLIIGSTLSLIGVFIITIIRSRSSS